jgi:ATP/ADP translocase
MNVRVFNIIASVSAFALGTAYVFSDSASITANVVGASGPNAGLVSIVGIVMVIGAIGLFIVSLHSSANHNIALEKLIRKTKNHEELREPMSESYKDLMTEEKPKP